MGLIMTSYFLFQNTFIPKRSGVINFADFMKKQSS